MKDLYPEIRPYRAEHLAVDELHSLYVEEVGTSHGIPAQAASPTIDAFSIRNATG